MPKIGLQMEVKLNTGAFKTIALQASRMANNMMPRWTVLSLIFSVGILRRRTFITIPCVASRKPR